MCTQTVVLPQLFNDAKKQILIVELSEYFLFLILENFAQWHTGSVSGLHKQQVS
jgi:hypothetical protein